ncbi:MAG: GFA family protein [Betaproteobacteria bacterium]
MRIDGACHCGKLACEADIDPEKVGVCHCTDCQTLTGSAFAMFVPVPKGSFRLHSGQPKIYVKTAESGAKRAQAFCADCGTRLYASAAGEDPPVFNVRVGTVRQRAQLRPKIQLWCRSAQPWTMDLGAVEKIETQPPM